MSTQSKSIIQLEITLEPSPTTSTLEDVADLEAEVVEDAPMAVTVAKFLYTSSCRKSSIS